MATFGRTHLAMNIRFEVKARTPTAEAYQACRRINDLISSMIYGEVRFPKPQEKQETNWKQTGF